MDIRITGHGVETPKALLDKVNPLNPWRATDAQMRLLSTSLNIGIVDSVKVNTVTGHVLDGEKRIRQALAEGAEELPVAYVEVSAQEERQLLALINQAGMETTLDEPAFAGLMDGLDDLPPDVEAELDRMSILYGFELEELGLETEAPPPKSNNDEPMFMQIKIGPWVGRVEKESGDVLVKVLRTMFDDPEEGGTFVHEVVMHALNSKDNRE